MPRNTEPLSGGLQAATKTTLVEAIAQGTPYPAILATDNR
jgi:hypothetical protein